MDDYISRMIDEKKQLDERLNKLIRFSESNADKLDEVQKFSMNCQRIAMQQYTDVLGERIKYESQKARNRI